MGCCASREASHPSTSPYPPVSDGPEASSRHITTTTPPRSSSIATPRSNSHAVAAAASSNAPSSQPEPAQAPAPSTSTRPNAALKPLSPTARATLPTPSPSTTHTSTQTTWTPARLAKERADWWDTRTTGDAETWGALRVVVACLQQGDVTEAQALLDAVECTCPNGVLWRGVFDARGEWYRVPEWIVLEPVGVAEEDKGKGKGKEVVSGDGEGVVEEAAAAGKENEELNLGEVVKVRVRLSTDGRDVVVKIHKGEKVAGLIANLKIKAKLSPFASLRIVYAGKIFDENFPLDAHPLWGYDAGQVLVAMVFE